MINSARAIPSRILSFFGRHCETVKGATALFPLPQIPDDEFIFTQEILRKAFYYADLEGQVLLSLAVCLGNSVTEFLELEFEKLRNLLREAGDKNLEFIQFIGKSRSKTSVQPRCHLTPEALHSLKECLPLLEKKYGKPPKYLWTSNQPDKHLSIEGLNKRLRRILQKANIETYGKTVRFHLFRKFLYSRLQTKNRDLAKVITSKKVSASDITYIPDLNAECLRVFKETYKELALNGDLTGKTKQKQEERIKQLEQVLQQLEIENSTSKTRIDLLQKTTQKQQNKTSQLAKENQDLKKNYKKLKDAFEMFKNDFVKALEYQKLDIKTQSASIKGKKKIDKIRIVKEKE